MDKELGEEIRFRKALAYKQLAFIEENITKKKKLLEDCVSAFESEDRFKNVFSIIPTYYLDKGNKAVIMDKVKEALGKEKNAGISFKKAGTLPDYIIPQFLLMMVIKDSTEKKYIEIKAILFKNLKDAIENLLPSFSGNSNVLASWHYALGILYQDKVNGGKALEQEHFEHARNYAYHSKRYGVKRIFDSDAFGEIPIDDFIAKVEQKINPNGVK